MHPAGSNITVVSLNAFLTTPQLVLAIPQSHSTGADCRVSCPSWKLLLPRLDTVVAAIATFSKSGHRGQPPALCLVTGHREVAHASLPVYGSLHF